MTHPYLQRLNTLQSPQWRTPFPDTMLKIAHSYALQFRAPDPESDAQEALAWLWQKLPQHIDLFVTPSDTFDEDGLMRWSRTVIRNKLHELRRRASREPLTSACELDLEHFNTSKRSSSGQDNGPPSNVETLFIERDKLLLLLSLILQKPQKVELILGRMAGFSPEQLSSCLPFAKDSIPVIVCNWKSELLPKLNLDRRPIRPQVECTPDQDVPLFTGWTPRLMEAFRDLPGTGGLDLLKQLMTTPPRERHRYLARMAGFWDAVVADVWEQPLSVHRRLLEAQRTRLEHLLQDNSAPPPQDTLHVGDSGTMSHTHILTVSGQDAAQMQALLELAQRAPAEVLRILLADADVLRGLERGRRALRVSQSTPRVAPAELVAVFWQAVQNLQGEMSRWLEPVVPQAVAMRSAQPEQQFLALRAGEEVNEGTPGVLVLWKLDAQGINPVRPVSPGAGLPEGIRPGDTWLVRGVSESVPVRLLLLRVPVDHPRLALLCDREALAEVNLEALLQDLEAEAVTGTIAIQWLEV